MWNCHFINNKDELINMFMLETSYLDNFYKDIILLDLGNLYHFLPLKHSCFDKYIVNRNEQDDIVNLRLLETLINNLLKYMDANIFKIIDIPSVIKDIENSVDYLNENYKLSLCFNSVFDPNDYLILYKYIELLVKELRKIILPYVGDVPQILKSDEELIELPNTFWYNSEINSFLYGSMFRMHLPIVVYRIKQGLNDVDESRT